MVESQEPIAIWKQAQLLQVVVAEPLQRHRVSPQPEEGPTGFDSRALPLRRSGPFPGSGPDCGPKIESRSKG